VGSTLHAGLELHRATLAERWQRAVTRTGAVPYSAAEVGERLLELVDTVVLVLAGDDDPDSATGVGRALISLGFRSPEALSQTLELFSTFALEQYTGDELQLIRPRLARLLGGIAIGFDSTVRRQLLDDQEASRAAVLAENRRAWDALRRQAALLDLAPDAILVREIGSGRIAFWNRGAETLYGWSRDEALEQPSHLLLQTESTVAIEEIEATVFRDGHWEGELSHTRRDGTRLVVSSRWAAQWDAEGRPLACLEINTDISARKQMEADLRDREANLERAQSLAHLGSWEWNLVTDTLYWSPEAYLITDTGCTGRSPTMPRWKPICTNRSCTLAASPLVSEALRTSTVIALAGACTGGSASVSLGRVVFVGFDGVVVVADEGGPPRSGEPPSERDEPSLVSPATNWCTASGSTLITSAPPILAPPRVGIV